MEYNLCKIENSYNYKRANFEKQLDSVNVIILGSSQAFYGINPTYFNLKSFNLANISQSLYYDNQLVLKYIDKMPNLKYVIINISYFSLSYQVIDGIESWRDYYYSQFWNINYPDLNVLDIKRYSKIFLYTPTISLSYLNNGFKVNLINGMNPNGYFEYDTTNNKLNISDSSGNQRVNFHENGFKEKRVNENKVVLESLIKELQKRNIKPVFVTPPVFSTYYKFVNRESLKKNKDIIDSFCIRYKCNYFNYFTDSRFIQSDFHDNDHLNFIGAEKFSKILNNEI